MIPDNLNPKTTIFPTFNCFNDSMEFIDHVARECPEKVNNLTLVHAICLSENGREYAHGWIEDTKWNVVIFCGIYMDQKVYLAAPFESYFSTYKVKESTRYTMREALKENLRTVHFGPWKGKYQALCGDKGERIVLGGGFMNNVSFIGSLPHATTNETKEE